MGISDVMHKQATHLHVHVHVCTNIIIYMIVYVPVILGSNVHTCRRHIRAHIDVICTGGDYTVILL